MQFNDADVVKKFIFRYLSVLKENRQGIVFEMSALSGLMNARSKYYFKGIQKYKNL